MHGVGAGPMTGACQPRPWSGFRRRRSYAADGTVVAEARASGLPLDLRTAKDDPRAWVVGERCGFSYVGEDETEHRLRLAT